MKTVLKIVAFFLLITVSIPLIFTFYFFVKRKVIQHEMKERLEQSSLHSVSVIANEVHWATPGKEVIVNGKMFDVDSYFIENNCYHFMGLFDDEETILNKQVESNTKRTNDAGNQMLIQIFQLFQFPFLENTGHSFAIKDSKSYEYCIAYPNIVSQFKSVPTPPPQG